MVPAGKARDLGLDRSMVLGYGHDDRICAYTSLVAILRNAEDETYFYLPPCGQGRDRKRGRYRYGVSFL